MRLAPGVLLVGLLAGLSAAAQGEWSQRDWRQWTEKDCRKMLSSSPWAKTIDLANDQSFFLGHERVSYTLQLISALPVRQALARQWQIENHYDQMGPEQRREADEKVNKQIGAGYRDRIVVRVIVHLLDISNPTPEQVRRYSPRGFWPWLVFPTGKSLRPRFVPQISTNSHGRWIVDATFQRIRGGKPLVYPTDKNLTFQLLSPNAPPPFLIFEFELRKMVYAGKLEY